MSIKFLKVKVKSLAAEAAIIRLEESRARGALRDELRAHRQRDVRVEQRASQLAYGYLRGVPRAAIEPGARSEPDWDRVERMVKRFGAGAVDGLAAWRTIAAREETSAEKIQVESEISAPSLRRDEPAAQSRVVPTGLLSRIAAGLRGGS